jgi:hypothetical protein
MMTSIPFGKKIAAVAFAALAMGAGLTMTAGEAEARRHAGRRGVLMAVELIVYRPKTFCQLIPSDLVDFETLEKVDPGRDLWCKLTMARNLKRHRFWRAVLSEVAASHMHYALAGVEALHDWIKMRLGLVDITLYHDGSSRVVPRSTAFNAMDETEFRAYLDRALQLIESEIMPGISIQDLIRHAEQKSGEKL